MPGFDLTTGFRPVRRTSSVYGRDLARRIRDPAADRREPGDAGSGSGNRSTTQPTTVTNPTTTRARTSLDARRSGRSLTQPIRPMRRSPTDPNTFSVNEIRSVTMTIFRFCCENGVRLLLGSMRSYKRAVPLFRRRQTVRHPLSTNASSAAIVRNLPTSNGCRANCREHEPNGAVSAGDVRTDWLSLGSD